MVVSLLNHSKRSPAFIMKSLARHMDMITKWWSDKCHTLLMMREPIRSFSRDRNHGNHRYPCETGECEQLPFGVRFSSSVNRWLFCLLITTINNNRDIPLLFRTQRTKAFSLPPFESEISKFYGFCSNFLLFCSNVTDVVYFATVYFITLHLRRDDLIDGFFSQPEKKENRERC